MALLELLLSGVDLELVAPLLLNIKNVAQPNETEGEGHVCQGGQPLPPLFPTPLTEVDFFF